MPTAISEKGTGTATPASRSLGGLLDAMRTIAADEEGAGTGGGGADAAATVYVQSGDSLTSPYADAHATRTMTVPLAGTVYVFEAVFNKRWQYLTDDCTMQHSPS